VFNEQKVAQMAAYLLNKQGGRFAHLKLMKLLYLSDREAMGRFGYSLSGDFPVSMPHGPVLSQTLSLISGDILPCEHGWDCWISDKENYEVSTKKEFTRNDLDELSEFDIEVLDSVWNRFGHMNQWEIRDYTHDYCSEWQDPQGSSLPIKMDSIFRALGKTEVETSALSDEIEAQKSISKIFASV